MKDLVIIGAGGFGREVIKYIKEINDAEPTWNLLGFIDDFKTEVPEGYPIIGNIDYLLTMDTKPHFAIAVADSKDREMVANRLIAADFPVATIIHPTVTIGPNCEVGESCIICGGTDLTTNVKIGKFCIINGACNFSYDAVMDDFCSMIS